MGPPSCGCCRASGVHFQSRFFGMGQVTYESTTPGFLLSLGGIHHWIIPRGTEEFAPALEAMRSLVRFAQFSRLGWVPGVVPTG